MMKLIDIYNASFSDLFRLKIAVDEAIDKGATSFDFDIDKYVSEPFVRYINFLKIPTKEEVLQEKKEELLNQLEEINNKLLEYDNIQPF